jgi:hypothetical protein
VGGEEGLLLIDLILFGMCFGPWFEESACTHHCDDSLYYDDTNGISSGFYSVFLRSENQHGRIITTHSDTDLSQVLLSFQWVVSAT